MEFNITFYGKEKALKTVTNLPSKEIAESYEKRIDAVIKKFVTRKEQPLDSFPVKEVIGEYGFVTKQLYQVNHEEELMLNVAASYRNPQVQKLTDEKYGEGISLLLAEAIETFYKKNNYC